MNFSDLFDQYRPELAKTAAVVVIGMILWWLIVRVGNRAIGHITKDDDLAERERSQRVATLWTVGKRTAVIVLFVIVVLTILLIWAIPVTPLLAVGSVVGVAIGFGAQAFVKDVIAGYFILAERQFDIGDVIRIAGVAGSVEDIRLRVTVLRDLEGVVHYIPNGEIAVASNMTQEFSRVVVDVPVAYGSDLDRAIGVLREELERFDTDEAWADAVEEPSTVLGVDALGESAVIIRLVLTLDPETRWHAKRELLKRIVQRFEAEEIQIPFQQLRVHMAP